MSKITSILPKEMILWARDHAAFSDVSFSKMADRQGFDSSQKHTPLHGISLANFGGNLNFGPTLVPASDSPSISFGNQPTTTPTASRGNGK